MEQDEDSYGRGPIMQAVEAMRALEAMSPEERAEGLRQYAEYMLSTGQW